MLIYAQSCFGLRRDYKYNRRSYNRLVGPSFKLYRNYYEENKNEESLEIVLVNNDENLEVIAKKLDSKKVASIFHLSSINPQITTLDEFRRLATGKVIWKKIVGLVGLGLFGIEEDIQIVLDQIQNSVNSPKVKAIALKSFILLIKEHEQFSRLKDVIPTYRGSFWKSVLVDIDFSFKSSSSVAELLNWLKLSYNSEQIEFIFYLFEKLTTQGDADIVMSYLQDSEIISSNKLAGLLRLQLNKTDKNFIYYIDYILQQPNHLEIYHKYLVHEKIAALAVVKDFDVIKSYIVEENYNVKPSGIYNFELKNINNKYFLDWILSCAFSNLCQKEDMPILTTLLSHHYWTVKNAAVKGILRVAENDDLEILVNNSIDHGGFTEQMLDAISVLDIKFYSERRILKLQERKEILVLSRASTTSREHGCGTRRYSEKLFKSISSSSRKLRTGYIPCSPQI